MTWMLKTDNLDLLPLDNSLARPGHVAELTLVGEKHGCTIARGGREARGLVGLQPVHHGPHMDRHLPYLLGIHATSG